MMYRTLADLGVYPPSVVVKVDDTAPGIHEATAAGTWAVGVTASGNEVGLSLDEWNALSATEQAAHVERAGAVLRQAGAHYLIDTVAQLPAVLDDIERRLAAGERPPLA
jgi:phosphonoacetaldehyde hydrolase